MSRVLRDYMKIRKRGRDTLSASFQEFDEEIWPG